MEISLSVSVSLGLTWPIWKRLVRAVDELGFAGLYCSDHLGPAGIDGLDAVLALGYTADQTRNVHFGTLVAPVSFRDPVILG